MKPHAARTGICPAVASTTFLHPYQGIHAKESLALKSFEPPQRAPPQRYLAQSCTANHTTPNLPRTVRSPSQATSRPLPDTHKHYVTASTANCQPFSANLPCSSTHLLWGSCHSELCKLAWIQRVGSSPLRDSAPPRASSSYSSILITHEIAQHSTYLTVSPPLLSALQESASLPQMRGYETDTTSTQLTSAMLAESVKQYPQGAYGKPDLASVHESTIRCSFSSICPHMMVVRSSMDQRVVEQLQVTGCEVHQATPSASACSSPLPDASPLKR